MSLAAYPPMMQRDRKREGLRVCRAAWLVGVTVREYREMDAGDRASVLRMSWRSRIQAWIDENVTEHCPRCDGLMGRQDNICGRCTQEWLRTFPAEKRANQGTMLRRWKAGKWPVDPNLRTS
jgi:hypothetical protein